MMVALIDDAPAPVKIELAQIIHGECADKDTAYDHVHALQQRIDALLQAEFPHLTVTLSAATYGDADKFDAADSA